MKLAVTVSANTTRTSRLINGSCEDIYRAFLDSKALATWQAPQGMTAKVHAFDARVGGGYTMSLFYSADVEGHPGKTAEREDRYTARFVELTPPSRIVEAITFDTDDPAFAGEMLMTVTLEERESGTMVLPLREPSARHSPRGQ